MSTNLSPKDFSTQGYVLRRTNYGEADRILNLLTPMGKISVIAKGVRKEKSKLAGGIEMFCLGDFQIHQGLGRLGVVTGAKMLKFHQGLVANLDLLETATLMLKKVSIAVENSENPVFFEMIRQAFLALDRHFNPKLVEAWFWLNFAQANGEELNLYRDTTDNKLLESTDYVWDTNELALKPQIGGNIDANTIKLMRLLLTADLELVNRIKNFASCLEPILFIAKSINQL